MVSAYPTVDQAVAHILQVGQGVVLAKVDVAHAFRNIPVHPDDRHLLGMRWEDAIFIDMALPFGLCSSPKIFTAVADALECVFWRRGVSWCTHYVDDFLTAGRPASEKCRSNLQVMLVTLGCPPESRQIERPINISDILRNHSGNGDHGDPAVPGETGSLKPGNSDVARQAGMQKARVAVTDWKVISCVQGGAG